MNEKMKSSMWKVLLVIVLVALAGVGTALIQGNKELVTEEAPDIEFEWAAPTMGSPVHHYVAEVRVNEMDIQYFDNIAGEELLVPSKFGDQYRIRVAGVDSEGYQGPWSDWSQPYFRDISAPGI